MSAAALFDVDGTLIDSNYHHTIAWSRAFRRFELTPSLWRIHRAIGMGGDHLVTEVAGQRAEDEHGDALRAAWGKEYEPLLGEVRPFRDAHALLLEVKRRGWAVVLASSAPKDQLEHYIDLLDADGLADEVTSADDVQATKPAPDLVSVAVQKAGASRAVMVGDSTWDAIAAGKVGVDTIAVRTGGFSEQELRSAGAIGVFSSLTDLLDHLDGTPLQSG
jgi:HAD superfamily hydrolase (TIGR01549 family)